MSKRLSRPNRWSNWRVSASGRTVADIDARRKKNTGKAVPTGPVQEVTVRRLPPWKCGVWIGPIRARYSDKCLVCTMDIVPNDIIVFRRSRSGAEETYVICLMCAESLEELDIRPPG